MARGLCETPKEKKCPHCNLVLEIKEFHSRGPGKTLQSWCKNCTRTRGKLPQRKTIAAKYRNSKKGKITSFRGHQGVRYKLTITEFETMIEKQNNCCAICGKEFNNTKRTKGPYVDHDHNTGKVRELLCHNCNLGIGHFGDNLKLVHLGYLYLLKHQGTSV